MGGLRLQSNWVPCVPEVASFPGPRPASRRLQYGKATASDGKLGGGLGTRLFLKC